MEFRPQKSLGQNFLVDKNIASKIVRQVDAPSPRLIVEIGPGKGVLTEFLLGQCEQYIGVEIDRDLCELLNRKFGESQKFHLLEQDFLTVDLKELATEWPGFHLAIVGNIPYHLTSPILFKLFDETDVVSQAVLMVQKEVADRMVAPTGGKTFGLLSIYSQLFADVQYLFTVPAKLFSPRPKVDSAVIKLNFRKNVLAQFSDFTFFRRVVNHCFRHRRKMLRKSLSMLFDSELIRKFPLDLTRRPEQLTLDEWKQLVNILLIKIKRD